MFQGIPGKYKDEKLKGDTSSKEEGNMKKRLFEDQCVTPTPDLTSPFI